MKIAISIYDLIWKIVETESMHLSSFYGRGKKKIAERFFDAVHSHKLGYLEMTERRKMIIDKVFYRIL